MTQTPLETLFPYVGKDILTVLSRVQALGADDAFMKSLVEDMVKVINEAVDDALAVEFDRGFSQGYDQACWNAAENAF